MEKVIVLCIGSFPPPVQGAAIINEGLYARLQERNIPASRIDLSPGYKQGVSYHITRLLRTLRGVLDIIFATGPRRCLMSIDGGKGIFYNILLATAMRARGQPRPFCYHSTSYLRTKSGLMWLLLKIAGKNTLHVACTDRMLSRLGTFYSARISGLVINNAAWVDLPPLSTGSGGRVLRLGLLSGLTVEKGPHRAVETLRELRHRGVNAELVLAGAIQDDATQALLDASRDEFGPAAQYAGIVTGGARALFYASLDYFLFPSLYRHETQSLVVPEALAAGTPVIAFDHAFVGELVGTGGHLIPADEHYASRAADWVMAGDAAARRIAARRQMEKLSVQARGQIDKILDWARGMPS